MGHFEVSDHGSIRMVEREVLYADIHQCGFTARSCTWQPEHQTYLVDGMDVENNQLRVAVGIDDGKVIVTVITREDQER